MLDPPMPSTDAGWCSFAHQSTESLMIGRLIAPTSVRMATIRPARDGSSTVCHSAMTPRYIRNSTSTEVSRRSHTQRSEEHTSELQSRQYLVCRLLLEKKQKPPKTKHRR